MVYSGFDRLNHKFATQDCQADPQLYLITDTEAGRVLDLMKTVDGFQGLSEAQVKEIWEAASQRFAENAQGDVQTNVIDARQGWVFRHVELPALLVNEAVTSINGIPIDQLRVLNDGKTMDLDSIYEHICHAELARDRAAPDRPDLMTRVEWKTTALELQPDRELEHQQELAQRGDARAERLSQIPEVQEIGRAWDRSDSGHAFAQALEEHNILIACVSREDAASRTRQQETPSAYGYELPKLQEGHYVAVTKEGQVYPLDHATLGVPQEQVDARLKQLEPDQHVTVGQAREFMTFWREVERHEHTERLTWQDVKYIAMDTAHCTVNLVGAASLLGGYAVRTGEFAFRALGGVLDYFFGGLLGDGMPRRIVRDDDKTFLEKTPRAELLNHPRVVEILNSDKGTIPLPVLEELRRQQEQRARERAERER